MRIVHYVPKFSRRHWGGAEQAIVSLSQTLKSEGFESSVWTNRIFSDVRDETIDGMAVHRFDSFFLSRREAAQAGTGKAPLSLSLLKRLWSDGSIDALHVHCHNRMASTLVLESKARKLPVFLTLHSAFRDLRPRARYWFSNRVGVEYASHVFTVAGSLRDSLVSAGVQSDRVTVLPNGVDQAIFAGGCGDRFRAGVGLRDQPLIMTVGRICEVKNQRVVLDVLPLVRQEVGEAHWVLVGVPSEPDYLERLQKDLIVNDLKGLVHIVPGLPPQSEELADAFAAANVFVVPSQHEAFGLVVLEAWSAGAPVVANAVSGLNELIHDGETGLMVEPRDPEEMSRQIVSLLKDPSLRNHLVRCARDRVKEYDWAIIGKNLALSYRQVIDG
jgi:glycosyltransferase involved in cell wall biosynthesis